jgi:thiamine-phosphate pyrophosphorylase
MIVCYVTDSSSLPANSHLLDCIRSALSAGVDWIQIREKILPASELLDLTRDAIAATHNASCDSPNAARIFVNDRLDVALAAGAAGVHLGGESIPVAAAADWCRTGSAPAGFVVGASCHGDDEARAAERAGADYIFFGPVFDTPSKRSYGAPQGLERLGKVCAAVKIPVIAIGGINEKNAAACIRAGASGIAAIRLFQKNVNGDGAELRNFIATIHAL